MSRFNRLTVSLALAILVSLSAIQPTFAANGVTLEVTAGTRTASIADLDLAAIGYSHSPQAKSGTMTLTTDDSTGSGAGWNVTVQSSPFVYTGTSASGVNIPAANFSITTANAPVMTAGQVIDATNGPKVPASGATGTLDSAHKVIQANATYGQGIYTQALDVSLAVPALSSAGDYAATLTVSITAAP